MFTKEIGSDIYKYYQYMANLLDDPCANAYSTTWETVFCKVRCFYQSDKHTKDSEHISKFTIYAISSYITKMILLEYK